jgi:hypothetical protein
MKIEARLGVRSALVLALAACPLARSASTQVPPPRDVAAKSAELSEARQAIVARESQALQALARRLDEKGDAAGAKTVRALAPAPRPADGASRLVPLPEVVPASGTGLASVRSRPPGAVRGASPSAWQAELDEARAKVSGELFDLANRAASASPPRLAEAALCLRLVLERDPNDAEARRLLGYVPFKEGWARPFAVRQFRDGNVDHPVFGWVSADWAPHLDAGELPATQSRGGARKTRWLPVAEADRLRADWDPPWQITTEHFQVQTNVPLGEAIEFGRRLERFYDVFFTLMADVVGETLPLARRLRSPTLTGDASYRQHQVLYFATKEQYVERVRSKLGADAEQSLGYYDPPRPGSNRATAYFFRDAGGVLPVTATLYHEVSHQLLFETAGPNAFTKNVGNYWVFEGLGTYFETVTPKADGSLEVGGLVGERLAAARRTLADGRFEPLEVFLRLDQAGFNRPDRIHDHYQQAMALAIFLMQADRQTHRDAFLEYVRDAYRGRIKRTTGRSLEDRIGVAVREIDERYRAYLVRGPARPRTAVPEE